MLLLGRSQYRCALSTATLLSFLTCAQAFYLPGAAPHDYAAEENVSLFVNALTPMLGSSDNAKLVSRRTDTEVR